MLTGLSAFPPTPRVPPQGPVRRHRDSDSALKRALTGSIPVVDEFKVDEDSFSGMVRRLARAGVDSIGALGSIGSYAYLSTKVRARVARLAVEAAEGTPVFVGVGAMSTRDVLRNCDNAAEAGASALLLAPMSYQPLTESEVFELYQDVNDRVELPIIVYSNPATTGTTMSVDLYGRLAELPRVASLKIPPLPSNEALAFEQFEEIKEVVPEEVTVGVSGDATAVSGLIGGAQTWYSVLAGLLPEPCLALTRAAQSGDAEQARAISQSLKPVWRLFSMHGSYRVVSAMAVELGLARGESVYMPVKPLEGKARADVARVVEQLPQIG